MTLPFWHTAQLARQYQTSTALIVDESKVEYAEERKESVKKISYEQLDSLVEQAKLHITHEQRAQEQKPQEQNKNTSKVRQLLMFVAQHTVNSIVYYLAALQLKQVVWWIDKELSNEKRKKITKNYRVNLLIDDGKITQLTEFEHQFHPELSLLLSTSGSTGSSSLVRLSYQNLQSNCHVICQTLAIKASDSVITTLPLQYCFGLSIIHTHLCQGASIVLNEHGLLTREFWQSFKKHQINCLYGVPFSFEMLLKLNLARIPLQSLRYLAVAGGKLAPDKVTQINQWCKQHNKLFFVMYGQTEATARISVLAPEKLQEKPNAIGQAIVGGKLWLEDINTGEVIDSFSQNNLIGELCYSGENVMMGLASNITDFNLPAQAQALHTGDLATCDSEGDFTIIGRLKRFIKVIGQRINLDEVEAFLLSKNIQAICCGKDDLIECYLLCSSLEEPLTLVEYQQMVAQFLNIHSRYCQCFIINEIPHLSSGKVDYQSLSLRVDNT